MSLNVIINTVIESKIVDGTNRGVSIFHGRTILRGQGGPGFTSGPRPGPKPLPLQT